MDEQTDQNGRQPAEENASTQTDEKLGIRHILTSVLAAAIGVQNRKNQEKDFGNRQSIYIYIAAGIVFTALFVVSVFAVVKLVLSSAGA